MRQRFCDDYLQMSYILLSLWPLFVFILAGYGMKRFNFPSEGFLPGAERFNYFIPSRAPLQQSQFSPAR